MRRRKFDHRTLCFSLAEAKGTQYVEIPLGSQFLNANQVNRADVICVRPSYTRFTLDIYEVKTNRNDFLGDINSGKYKAYIPHCHRLYFACVKDIVSKDEVPDGIGLWLKGDKGWYQAKTAVRTDTQIPQETLLSLLFYRGRVFNTRRENLLRKSSYAHLYSHGSYPGLDKKIKKALTRYEKLEMAFRHLMYSSSNRINFPNETAQEEWESQFQKHLTNEH